MLCPDLLSPFKVISVYSLNNIEVVVFEELDDFSVGWGGGLGGRVKTAKESSQICLGLGTRGGRDRWTEGRGKRRCELMS